MKNTTFSSANKTGKLGIPYVTKYWEDMSFDVMNVEDDPECRDQDIDLIISKDTSAFKIEVKTDFTGVHNYAFETVSNYEKDTPGCFIQSKAHIWCYCFMTYRWAHIHIFHLNDMRAWFLANQGQFTTAATSTGTLYQTHFQLVPIKDVPEGMVHVEKVDRLK